MKYRPNLKSPWLRSSTKSLNIVKKAEGSGAVLEYNDSVTDSIRSKKYYDNKNSDLILYHESDVKNDETSSKNSPSGGERKAHKIMSKTMSLRSTKSKLENKSDKAI